MTTQIAYSYIENNTRIERHGTCSSLTAAAAARIAAEYIDATELDSGDYIYWPAETPGEAYVVDSDELAALGAALHCASGHDVYSLWCAGTGRRATDAEMARG